jgi:DNA polymerase-1
MPKTLLIDTSYLIFRSYFAYPDLTTKSLTTGEESHVGAFFGFAKTILALVKELQPEILIFADDRPEPTWRHKVLEDYKAGRPPLEDKMLFQLPLIKSWAAKVSPNYEAIPGFEADDIIKTYCDQLVDNGSYQTYVFSSDRDLYQLLTRRDVCFLSIEKSNYQTKFFGTQDFIEKYEIQPEQWLDYKALVGDNSDNLKGVAGIGPKTAISILQKIGKLEYLLNYFDTGEVNDQIAGFVNDSKNAKVIDKIKLDRAILDQTKYLATLQTVPNIPISLPGFDFSKGLEMFQEYNFSSLIKQLSNPKVQAKSNNSNETDAQDSLF